MLTILLQLIGQNVKFQIQITIFKLKCPFLDLINNFQTRSINFENPK
jgi:hypothetical protein